MLLENLKLPTLREAGAPPLPCEEGDPELWFHPHPRQQARAITICRTVCPVQKECLRQALEMEKGDGVSRHGIFGGTQPATRIKMARKLGHTTQRKGIYQ